MADNNTNMFFEEKNISDIDVSCNRVSVLGKVISVKGSSFILDDSTGSMSVSFKPGVEIIGNSVVRVFGVVGVDSITAEIVQDLSELDILAFKRSRIIG